MPRPYCFRQRWYQTLVPGRRSGIPINLEVKRDDEVRQLERFLSIATSERHSMLLDEMREGFFDDTVDKSEDPFILIKKMRDELRK